VTDEIKRQGYKIKSYEASEVTALAKAYLEKHPAEYFARAAQTIWNTPVLRRMAEREQANSAQKAKA
jgi:hypothetical protein